MILACIISGVAGGVVTRIGLALLWHWQRVCSNRPHNVFFGYAFPHPDDDGWKVVNGEWRNGPVRIFTVHTYGSYTLAKLQIGNVLIQVGGAADAYMRRIERAHTERERALALAQLP